MARCRRGHPWKTVLILAAVAIGTLLLTRWGLMKAYPLRYEAEIRQYAEEYGVSPVLICGVIHTESRFDPKRVSSAQARGLMQITEETYDWIKWRLGDETTVYDDMFVPETNIRYGTFLLSQLLEEFGRTEEALAAYHAGRGSVNGWLKNPEFSRDGKTLNQIPFATTAKYAPRVMRTAGVYQKLYFNS